MGRYKRHSKTKTITRGDTKLTYTVIKHVEEKKKSPLTAPLVADFLLAIKKNNKYGDFSASYMPFNDFLYDDSKVRDYIGGRVIANVGDKLHVNVLIYRWYFKQYYNTLLGKICLLQCLLVPRHIPLVKSCATITKSELLEYYAKEEIKKKNIKVYPNNLVFASLIGTIFGAIGFFSFILVLWLIFGYLPCIIYGLFVSLLLSIKP